MVVKVYPNGGMKEVVLDDGQAVRRSNRMRYKPLEYWRNERVVYGRRKSGMSPIK
jgi:centromere protein C